MNLSDRPKISVFIATSIDSCIAKKNNDGGNGQKKWAGNSQLI